MKKLIDFSEGNLHDINHFVKVWAYAKTIGGLEKIDETTQCSATIPKHFFA